MRRLAKFIKSTPCLQAHDLDVALPKVDDQLQQRSVVAATYVRMLKRAQEAEAAELCVKDLEASNKDLEATKKDLEATKKDLEAQLATLKQELYATAKPQITPSIQHECLACTKPVN